MIIRVDVRFLTETEVTVSSAFVAGEVPYLVTCQQYKLETYLPIHKHFKSLHQENKIVYNATKFIDYMTKLLTES